MNRLREDLAALRQAAVQYEVAAPGVSKWSVGMHVEHCCLVMQRVCQALKKSTPPKPKARFSILTFMVFLTGRFPRGKGKAPKEAIPETAVNLDRLQELLSESEELLNQVGGLDSGVWFQHFIFGPLDRDKTLKFLHIHNRHHRRILDDILAG